jgi:hypothetical protein
MVECCCTEHANRPGIARVLPNRTVGNGMNDWSIREILFSHTIPLGGVGG